MPLTWVFDLDDTLYLERDYVRSGFDAVGRWAKRDLGVSDVAAHAWRRFCAGERGTTLTDALVDCGVAVTPELAHTVVEVYRTHEPAITLCPDASVLFRELRAEPYALITDGPAPSQRAKIRALGLAELIAEVVVTAEHDASWHKPGVLAYRRVEHALGVEGAGCVYVADNPSKDFAGAKRLGWRTVRIRRPGGLYADLEDDPDEVDVRVTTLTDLPRSLS